MIQSSKPTHSYANVCSKDSGKKSSVPSSPQYVAPKSLSAQLSVTSPKVPKLSEQSVLPSRSRHNTIPSGSSSATPAFIPSASFLQQPIPDSLRPGMHSSHLMYQKSQHTQISPVRNTAASNSPPSSPPRNSHNPRSTDGFQRNKHDIRRDRTNEQRRNKVVYGTKRVGNTRLSDGVVSPKDTTCDIFVYHVKHEATTTDLRSYMCENGVDMSGVRIDITSHQLSEFKSFRVIAPSMIRDHLLSPDFWPVNVRVKEFKARKKRSSDTVMNDRRGYSREHYNNHYGP